jgi:ABC-2 type transport system permease protein
MRRILSQARKELIQIFRDRLALLLALVLPLILLFLLGTALSLNVHDLPLIVQDFDDSAASRSLIDAFRSSITFRVVSWPTDRAPELAFNNNTARAALIIPEHFDRSMARGSAADVQLLVDATDANTAKLTNAYATEIISAYNDQSAGVMRVAPITAEVRLWYNPGKDAKKFYGPGIFVLGLSMFPPLLAALAMSREGEEKTILQVYVSSIPAYQFLLGKILAFMVIAMLEWMLSMTALFTYFGLRFAGDPTPFLVATVLYAFCVASFGTLIGVAIPNQAAAIQAVALGGFLLVFLLSGLIFPVENIPAGLRWVSNIVWGRYYIEVVRDALLKGGGWPAMWFRVLMIGIIGMVFYLIAWRNMRAMQLNV